MIAITKCACLKYPNSTANTRLVGKQTGLLVNAIRDVFYNSNPWNLKIHCIGHSLGAHTLIFKIF